MIYGIGTDIVSIERIRRALDRHGERLARRVLAPQEVGAFEAASDQGAFLAKRFAAKEAAVKALGIGFRDGLVLRDIYVEHDRLGKPELRFQNKAREFADRAGVGEGFISVTDEKDYALAFVTLCLKQG